MTSSQLDCAPFLYDLMRHCVSTEPTQRPTFAHIREMLEKVVRNPEILNEKYSPE